MLHGEEDVPSKLVLHLVNNVEAAGKSGHANPQQCPSILVEVINYSTVSYRKDSSRSQKQSRVMLSSRLMDGPVCYVVLNLSPKCSNRIYGGLNCVRIWILPRTRHAWTALPRMSSPQLGCPCTCDTIPHLMPRDNSETSRQLLWLLRDTNREGKRKYPGQSLAEFYSPSAALCNAPFNAPCSPVTPLLLVIAWYCTVLPCAPSRRQPQSPHTAQQAAAAVARASVRGHGWDF